MLLITELALVDNLSIPNFKPISNLKMRLQNTHVNE